MAMENEELPFISTAPCPSLTSHTRTYPRLEYLGIRSYVLTRLALQWRIQDSEKAGTNHTGVCQPIIWQHFYQKKNA